MQNDNHSMLDPKKRNDDPKKIYFNRAMKNYCVTKLCVCAHAHAHTPVNQESNSGIHYKVDFLKKL